jgi:hypothetical protein
VILRIAIRNKLIADIPEIAGRVYEPHQSDPSTVKPFVMLRQGADTADTPGVGFRRIMECWPYASKTTFQDVDTLANKVIASLDRQMLTDTATGEVFTVQYYGTVGTDVVDDQWDAITRGLNFAVFAVQPAPVVETFADDPWLDALAEWTESAMGSPWMVYRNVWPLGHSRPSVMWRIAGMEVQQHGRGMFAVRKKFTGHIFGTTPNEQVAGVLKITQELGNAFKLALDLDNKRYLTVIDPMANLKAEALTGGQITVTLSRLTMRPAVEVPYMAKVQVSGVIPE